MTSVVTRGGGSVSSDGQTGRHRGLCAAGTFDLANRDLLEAAILAASGNGAELVEIDFTQVRFIDAGVIRTLMSLRETLAARGCVLKVVAGVGPAAVVLDLTRTRAALCGE